MPQVREDGSGRVFDSLDVDADILTMCMDELGT